MFFRFPFPSVVLYLCIWNKCTNYYTKADSFCYNPRMRDYQVKNQLQSRPIIGYLRRFLASYWLPSPQQILPGPEIRADQVKKQLVPLGYCKCGVMVQCCSSIATTPDPSIMDTHYTDVSLSSTAIIWRMITSTSLFFVIIYLIIGDCLYGDHLPD